MANFHPSENTLIEFSAGNLDWALSICVSAHLQFCPHCAHKVSELNAIGGALIEQTKPAQVCNSSFDSLMQRIKNSSQTQDCQPIQRQAKQDQRTKDLPEIVQKLIPKDKTLKWSFVSSSLKSARLDTGQGKYEVCFHKIKRGGKVVEHDHRGLEVTLVLEGSFSDENGSYMPGDYIVKEPGEIHRPMATQDQDCLCLSVVEAPVKVTGFAGKIINPFLRINPR
ncbi:ChrR family anti-sigma-E factor [Agarilytica rhodophyticola]|uniref:ChrR family anti-sigma-E factor n=1 Tax=Agarilytica rhodophyticola TaxID=1737490 RepID=UPI000B349A28|nr:ChrR family anti-sigma-E factor [Agarilytica rhodophyticola]